jgi:hypothetical protein
VAATLSMIQFTSSSAVQTNVGGSGNAWNYMNIDVASPALYAANPILFGNNSFEVWLQAMFTGLFTEIRDLRMWLSTDFSPATGLFLFFAGTQQIFLTPGTVSSSIATSSFPTADPGSANVSIGGNLSGSIVTSSGRSDFIVSQLRTTASAPAGDTSFATISFSYSEV